MISGNVRGSFNKIVPVKETESKVKYCRVKCDEILFDPVITIKIIHEIHSDECFVEQLVS